MYIRDFINFKLIELPNHLSHLEILIIELQDVKFITDKLVIATCYNPPSPSQININALDFIFNLSSNVLLLGDLNSHHQLWHCIKNCPSGTILHKFIQDKDCCILNDDKPTYQPENRPDY